MNAYQLENKTMDALFLDGKAVTCPAVIDQKETGVLKEGMRLVILLSNGKKYMGEVTRYTYSVQKGHAVGALEIIRYPRLRQDAGL
jgi:hypothetical protein